VAKDSDLKEDRQQTGPEQENTMADRRLGIIVNGATGGLATGQHLRALLAIRAEGGLLLADGDRVLPDPILVGRNAERLRMLATAKGVARWTTDLDAALSDAGDAVFFDAAATGSRYQVVSRAIEAGKHVYCEKPIAGTLQEALDLARAAQRAGVKNGTVQDKVFLPGFRKLRLLRDSGWFGRILEVRLECGRWVFDGNQQPANRPSWNYRKRDGGELVLDMFPHWRYMLDQLVGEIRAVSCNTRTHIPRRRDEAGQPYDVDVEDSVFAQMELEGGVIASVNTSWCTRIRRDDVITLQVDGTHGSALATAHDCFTQPDVATPAAVISVDRRNPMDFRAQWLAMPDNAATANSYRSGWELFIRHVMEDAPFPSPLIEGAKGVQLAELSYLSHRERRWVDVPPLS
jgi:predicted dehydrogenase